MPPADLSAAALLVLRDGRRALTFTRAASDAAWV
jgi:hypothetical protein